MDVVVVNYRTPDDLHEFLDSYPADSGTNLWIVNNEPGSDDQGIAAYFQDVIPHTRVINNKENLGYARAVNQAVAQGQSETIAIFNADIMLTPGALAKATNVLWQRPDFGIVGPKQVDQRNRITHAGIFGPETDPKHRGWLEYNRGQYEDIRSDAYSVSGSAYFIKRHVWESLTRCSSFRLAAPEATGAFLPTALFYEETWCSIHARHHGYKVVYDGHTTIIHKWHKSVKSNRINIGRMMGESQQYFRQACDIHGIVRQ